MARERIQEGTPKQEIEARSSGVERCRSRDDDCSGEGISFPRKYSRDLGWIRSSIKQPLKGCFLDRLEASNESLKRAFGNLEVNNGFARFETVQQSYIIYIYSPTLDLREFTMAHQQIEECRWTFVSTF